MVVAVGASTEAPWRCEIEYGLIPTASDILNRPQSGTPDTAKHFRHHGSGIMGWAEHAQHDSKFVHDFDLGTWSNVLRHMLVQCRASFPARLGTADRRRATRPQRGKIRAEMEDVEMTDVGEDVRSRPAGTVSDAARLKRAKVRNAVHLAAKASPSSL